MPEINTANIAEIVPEIMTNDPEKRLAAYRLLYAKGSVLYFEDIKDIYDSFAFDLIIVDGLYPSIPFIKHKLNIPVVSIGVVPLAEDSVDTAPYGYALPPAENEETRETYTALYQKAPDRYKAATAYFETLFIQYDIPFTRTTMENRLVKESDLFLQIDAPEFEYSRSDIGKNVHFVGALLPYAVDQHQQPWFDERLKKYDKIILVTQVRLKEI
ncbi:hypothetical protein SAMN06265348_102130 [Pedobacter westerhofensis]|uniref:Uncharacterized protein n=1 Tax=Pedobacter westerhofensis TaxID=425512 RepID=A0A521BAG9_9SPHI|nr:hypothetical protein [Pedobacter westerhofensis]SMO44078.1 hypothetical protein SAMN06265348_102130 [Pedobacter westerhofensis]